MGALHRDLQSPFHYHGRIHQLEEDTVMRAANQPEHECDNKASKEPERNIQLMGTVKRR